MPIGPRGERLPYNGNMGAGPGPDLPPMGPPQGPPMAGPPPGGDVNALMSELMQLTQRAEQIISQLESQGVNPEQLLAGGGPQAGPPVGGVGGMPPMPVAANTGPPRGLPPGLIA